MSGLSTMQKKIGLILIGVIVLVCTFVFLFQSSQEKVTALDAEAAKYEKEINYLSTLQEKVNQLQKTTAAHKTATEEYTITFPCQVPQQKAIYNVYNLMKKSKVAVTSIRPGEPKKFMAEGAFIDLDSEEAIVDEDAIDVAIQEEEEEEGNVERNPGTKVAIERMVGKVTTYEIDLSGNVSQIMKAVDWIAKNDEPMSVDDLSFTYDSSNGKLAGSLRVNFYELNGSGKSYREPNVSDITIGTENIFGVLKK